MPETKFIPSLRLRPEDVISWSHDNQRYAVRIERDETAIDPRTRSDSIVRINCSADNKYQSNEAFLADMIHNIVPCDVIAQRLREGAAKGSGFDEKHFQKPNIDLVNKYLTRMARGEFQNYAMTAIELLVDYAVIIPIWIHTIPAPVISVGGQKLIPQDSWTTEHAGWALLSKAMTLAKLTVTKPNPQHKLRPAAPAEITISVDPSGWVQPATNRIKEEVNRYAIYVGKQVLLYRLYANKYGNPDEAAIRMSWAQDWSEIDAAGNFYDGDIANNGMADAIQHGLMDALVTRTYLRGRCAQDGYTWFKFV